MLLDNSGVDSTHAVASLAAAHQKGDSHAGVAVATGTVQVKTVVLLRCFCFVKSLVKRTL